MNELGLLGDAINAYRDSNKNDKLVITNGEYINLCDFSKEHEEVAYIFFTRENGRARIWAYTTSRDNDTREDILSYARNSGIDGLIDYRSNFLVEDLLL